MKDDLVRRLAAELPGTVERDVRLDRFTTYRLGGPAAVFVEVADGDELDVVSAMVAEDDVDVLIVGRGSNLVVSDDGWPGVVLHLGKGFARIDEIDGGISAGGAAALPVVANWCARRGLSGLEFAVAIPGSVGGGVRMNAGAHGRELRDALAAATIVDVGGGGRSTRVAADLELAYRHSNLRDGEVVVEADFRLERADPRSVRERIESYRRHRAATQPGAAQNAGSVFRNPPGDHAGRLVEAAGLKGFRVGGAWVSELHANFFIADKGARAQDVYDLVAEVRDRVARRFGVELQPEIRFVGHFEEHLTEARS